MLRADALDLEILGELVEAALEPLARLHQVLDVVEGREVQLEFQEEDILLGREPLAREQFHKVAEVVARVE